MVATKQAFKAPQGFSEVRAQHVTEIDHSTAWTEVSVSSNDSAPTGESEGLACTNYKFARVMTHTLSSITQYTLTVWVNGGSTANKWVQLWDARDNASAVSTVSWPTLGTALFASPVIDVRGYDRVFVALTAIAGGGSITVALKVF